MLAPTFRKPRESNFRIPRSSLDQTTTSQLGRAFRASPAGSLPRPPLLHAGSASRPTRDRLAASRYSLAGSDHAGIPDLSRTASLSRHQVRPHARADGASRGGVRRVRRLRGDGPRLRDRLAARRTCGASPRNAAIPSPGSVLGVRVLSLDALCLARELAVADGGDHRAGHSDRERAGARPTPRCRAVDRDGDTAEADRRPPPRRGRGSICDAPSRIRYPRRSRLGVTSLRRGRLDLRRVWRRDRSSFTGRF